MRAKEFLTKFWAYRSEILNARKKQVIGSAIVTLSVCSLLQFTEAIESLENRIGRPALFSLRESLGMEPKLDPRIVVYAFNDDAVNEYGRPDILPGKVWGQILEAIEYSKPKAVFIDMIFGNPRKDKADVAAMNQAFKRRMPIFTGAAVLPAPLKKARAFDLRDKAFNAKNEDEPFLVR